MASYLFVFGRTPALSIAELHVFFPKTARIAEDVALVEMTEELDAPLFIRVLGGTVKIARVIRSGNSFDPSHVLAVLDTAGASSPFGVSWYGQPPPMPVPSLLRHIKELMIKQGRSSRFIQPRQRQALSSAVITKAGVHDVVIVRWNDGFILGSTVAVQRFEAWSHRDYARPHADTRSGMLPPKIARMIVNIAQRSGELDVAATKTLADPFCGMGTILAEALLRGWRVLGSDRSHDAARKAFENLTWIIRHTPDVSGRIERVFPCDAVHLSHELAASSVDAIVTEPYMGNARAVTQTHVSSQYIRNIIKGLEKLYIGCLRDWYPVLKPDGIVIIALPKYVINGREYFVKTVVDMCETLGYTIHTEPIDYGREHAVVRREFYIIRKKHGVVSES